MRVPSGVGSTCVRSGRPLASIPLAQFSLLTREMAERNWPETPGQFSGERVIGGDEAANSIVAARCAHDNFVFYNERCGCRAVIFVPIGVGNIPDQVARARVETEQMCVVGLPVDSGMPNGCATADVARGVINKAFAVRTRMMPDRAASTGIESVSIVGGSRKQYAVHNHRCNFQAV